MKRLFISLVAGVLLFFICFFGKSVIKARTNKIEQGIRNIRSSVALGDIKKARRLSRALEKEYVKSEKILSLCVSSDALSELGITISRLSPLLKKGASPEFFAELSSIRVQIIHIKSHS